MDIKEDFEDVLHKKLSKRSKSKNSEIQLLVNAFRFYDLDDKGIINKEDFSKVFGRIGLNGYSKNHLYQIFDIYDVNGVGYLDYINLIEYLYGLSTFQPLTQSSISNNQIQSNVNTNNYMNHNNNGISYQEQILGMRNQNYNQIYNQYFNQNVNNDYQNIERNYNQNYNQSLNQNYNHKIEDNLNYNQNINQSYNQNINQSYNQNINQNYNQNINQNYNQNINQRYNQNLNNNLRYFQQIGQQIQTPIPQINNLYKSQQITSNIQPQIQFQNPLNQSQFFKSTTPINLSNNYINRNNNLNNNYNHSEKGKAGIQSDYDIYSDPVYLAMCAKTIVSDEYSSYVYGWVEIGWGEYGNDPVVLSSAWDADGGPMIVGGGSALTPEPSSALLLLVGGALLALRRRNCTRGGPSRHRGGFGAGGNDGW